MAAAYGRDCLPGPHQHEPRRRGGPARSPPGRHGPGDPGLLERPARRAAGPAARGPFARAGARGAGRLARPAARRSMIAPSERRPVLLSGVCFFCVLASTATVRPVRDSLGLSGGVQGLPWLFTGTLLAM